MPSLIAIGTLAQSAASVVTPTSLLPGLPSTRTAGDWLFLHAACTSASATVATPSGWQSLVNAQGANARNALFALKSVGGGDAAPTVTWSGLTTGASGTPCIAHIINLGTGFGEDAGNLIVEATGDVQDQAASTTITAGGLAMAADTAGSIAFGMGARRDDAASGIVDDGTGVAWIGIFADQTTSGADMLSAMSYAIKDPGGLIGDHTFVLTGGASAASSGVMVAVKPTQEPVPTRQFTKSTVSMRRAGNAYAV